MNRKLRSPFEAPRCTVHTILTKRVVCSSVEIPPSEIESFIETEFDFYF